MAPSVAFNGLLGYGITTRGTGVGASFGLLFFFCFSLSFRLGIQRAARTTSSSSPSSKTRNERRHTHRARERERERETTGTDRTFFFGQWWYECDMKLELVLKRVSVVFVRELFSRVSHGDVSVDEWDESLWPWDVCQRLAIEGGEQPACTNIRILDVFRERLNPRVQDVREWLNGYSTWIFRKIQSPRSSNARCQVRVFPSIRLCD